MRLKKLLTPFFFLLLPALVFGQGSALNMSKLGQLTYTNGVNDVWGYADGSGNEYGLVGLFDGLSIVDVNDPSDPQELFFVTGPGSGWRDMKVWDGYAYVTNESNQGLLIVNLQYLPDSIQTSNWTGSGAVSFKSAHNIFIDEQGYGYIVGADYGQGGAIVVDLFTTPGTPILKTVYDVNYIHDCFVRGDTMWAGEIYEGWFSVVDMSDKSTPTIPSSKVMATQNTPNNFTHNVWLSDDGNYLYTTDERSGAFVAGYDVSDLSNIEETDRIRSSPGSGVVPHNTFFHNNFLITAYYRDGVTIVDAHRPHNLVETGFYDTSPMAGNGFNGAWGAYPYLPSGNILVSDMEEGLFVLGSTYTRACYLEGIVTDTFSTNPVSGVDVQIVSTTAADQTGLVGDYATGVADSGLYDVTFSKPGYRSKTIIGVRLDHGVVTQLDVALKPLTPINVTGQVVDSISGQGIPFAQVAFIATDTSFFFTCNNQGEFNDTVFADVYQIYAGAWGHRTKAWPAQVISDQTGPLTLEITEGYYDDFLLDFGWTETSTATTGQWERGIPIGTSAGSLFANPDSDLPGDFGEMAFVTGNGGGSVGDDDIDDGATTLLSPVFDLSAVQDPHLKFSYWFFNGFGSGNPNDYLEVHLSNGIDTVVILERTAADPGMSQWNEVLRNVSDYLTPTAEMQFTAIAVDFNPGHVVEAGLDGFEVIPGSELLQVAFDADVQQGCAPLTVQFTNQSQYFDSFKWVLEGTDSVEYFAMDPVVTYDTAGLYDVKLIAENQFGEDSVVASNYINLKSKPTIDYVVTNVFIEGQSNGSIEITPTDGNPPYSIQWLPGLGGGGPYIENLPADTYSVALTNVYGCADTFTFIVDFDFGTAIQTVPFEVEISPNPFSKTIRASLELKEAGELRVLNIAGQVLQRHELVNGSNQIVLDNFPAAGLYFIAIQSGDQRVTKPVIYQP